MSMQEPICTNASMLVGHPAAQAASCGGVCCVIPLNVLHEQGRAPVAAQQVASASNVTVKELLDWLMPRLDEAGRTEMLQAQVLCAKSS